MVGQSWDFPEDWMQTNVVSSAKLLTKLKGYDFIHKYVHVTTPEVYGSTEGWRTEDFNFNPSTPYAVSRAASDMLFKIYEKEYSIPIVFTRASNVYGEGQQLYRIIPLTIYNLLARKKYSYMGRFLNSVVHSYGRRVECHVVGGKKEFQAKPTTYLHGN